MQSKDPDWIRKKMEMEKRKADPTATADDR
jgi:hypothetical protein